MNSRLYASTLIPLASFVALLFIVAPASAAGTEGLKVSTSGTGTGVVEGPSGIRCGNGDESCEAQFVAKSIITLTANSTERSTFTGWSGCTELPSPTKCRVRISAGVQTEVSAEFTAISQKKLTVVNPGTGLGGGFVSAPEPGPEFSGIRCGEERESCEAEYNQGAIINLTAEPTERSTFNGWETGDCKSESGPDNDECMVEMTKAKTVKAEFGPISQESLTVAVEGTGQGTVTYFPSFEFAAIECGNGAAACEAQYNQGTTVILRASRAAHSKFLAWRGCSAVLGSGEFTTAECEVTMSAAKSVIAEFASIPQQNLEVSVTGSGEITSSPSGIGCTSTGGTCTEHFDSEGPESTVTLFASPLADHYVAWSGCNTASENECTVTMSAAKSVIAEFLPTMHSLFVTRTGSGEITSSPPGIACDEDLCSAEFQEGTVVILTAHPAVHNQLRAWGAGECREEPSPTECEIEIGSSAAIVQAEFTPVQHTLAIAVDGGGSVTAGSGAISGCAHGGGVCAGRYGEAATVVLTASPFPHSQLPTWSGCMPKPNPAECEVTIGLTDETVHAVFPPNTQTLTVDPVGVGSVGAGSGAIKGCEEGGGVCAGTYIEAATVTLTATPAAHKVVTWSGCTHFEGDTCEVEVGPSGSSVGASFSPITHTLTITKAGSGSGQVTCNGAPCAPSYPEGTLITIGASPAQGSTFAGWSGGGCQGIGPCHLTLAADTAVLATFTANPRPPVQEECVVPRLVGKTLAQARSALAGAHCSLGTVTKPTRRKGGLLVKSSSPSATTTLPVATKVNLVLGTQRRKGGK